MRMARRLGMSGSADFTILRKGSWTYPYGGEREWQTNIPEDWNYEYGTTAPTIDENGMHVFINDGTSNRITVANSGIGIDLTPYFRIRVKYSKWINCNRYFMTAIELQPVNSIVYTPYANAGPFRPQLRDDLVFTHADDPNPGEFVVEIPESAKAADPIRKLWVKAIKNYYYGDVSVLIESITFEK